MKPITDSGPGPGAAVPDSPWRPAPPRAGRGGDADPSSLGHPNAGASAPEVDLSQTTRFLLGDWLVDVAARRLMRGDRAITLEPRPMAVLATLCRQPGVVMSAETLLSLCWPDENLGDNPVHKVVAGLRKALEDSATSPRYIETLRKQGYRVVAPIGVVSAVGGTRSHEGAWRGDSPFCGLEAFDESHAAVFFGRDDAVAALQSRLVSQWRRRQPLVVLLGPSGSGKTSLVQAGLLPALRGLGLAARHAVAPAGLSISASATVDLASLGELDPWSALAGGLLDWEQGGQPLLSGHSITSLAELLRERPGEVIRLLDIALQAQGAPQGPVAPPLLVLDRLEAVLQLGATGDASLATCFIATVDALVSSGRVLVLALCRNDFYPALAQHPTLMRDKEQGAHMDLAPPDAEALAQMIRLPARAAGLVFGTDASGLNRLDDRLSADAMQSPDALPLLQYTLQALYLQREAGDVLSWQTYEAMGGLEGAIGRHAEAVLAGLPASRQEALMRLLPRIVSLTSEDATPTSRWAAAASLADDDERALAQAFVDARLLVADHIAGATGFRVAHEALLRQWPRVTAWVAQHRATLTLRDEMRHWVQRWVDGGQAAPLLLPSGGLLWQASRALQEAPALFSEEERRFVGQSLARLRRQRRLRWAATGLVTLLAAVAVLAAIAYGRQARLAADRERQSQHLASFMLGDLADQLRPIGKLSLLSRIAEQGVRVLAPADGAGESAAESLQRAKALVVIGEVNSSRGKGRTDVALEALEAARRLLPAGKPTSDVDTADYYRTLGASAFWLGQIALDSNDTTTAMQWFNAYREACEAWRKALPEDGTASMEWGYAVNSLGSTAFQQGAWAEAQMWFERALAQKQEALRQQPESRTAQTAVASSEQWLGMVYLVRGSPRPALAHLDVARDMLLKLIKSDPDERAKVRQLGVIDMRRADSLRAMGQVDASVAVMEDAVQRIKSAVSLDPDNDYWKLELAHAQATLLLTRVSTDAASMAQISALKASLQSTSTHPRQFVRRDAMARLAVTEVAIAAKRRDWAATLQLAAGARQQLTLLESEWPRHWQIQDLSSRLALLELQALNAQATVGRQAMCADLAQKLWPAVQGGQGGTPLEAWIAASHCAHPEKPENDFLRQLSTGGYVPVQPALL
ncbi:winged helix-turn-helix domain-containing protein [Roseateles sp. SL47]|uniref:nSTAND1 domain-containing NTPase n=1 Tax=Roseateles sp. SL47 TaxID=2995138 RepID=UPI00226DA2ED|nr:winged helix-turn-helix domain-containing protein [Roseateles sp. SL47]WAC71485.1 winged helix-turn-helix domain-containing protein [Roseateles sp. SL47]